MFARSNKHEKSPGQPAKATLALLCSRLASWLFGWLVGVTKSTCLFFYPFSSGHQRPIASSPTGSSKCSWTRQRPAEKAHRARLADDLCRHQPRQPLSGDSRCLGFSGSVAPDNRRSALSQHHRRYYSCY